ncbi:MAG: hypothetical protein WBB67_15325 [bacterium]
MKKSTFIFCLCTIMLFGQIKGVKQLEWIEPYGRQPLTYSKWCSICLHQSKPTRISGVMSKISGPKQNVVDIIVNARIYPELINELTVFTQDLVNAGYSVQLDTISGMSHIALRNHLGSIANLHGAIFVGEIPIAWFETSGFGGWEEFPHDLYFSDLDGTYIDADGDGIYDDHTGNVAPEIWVGRLYTRDLTWDSEVRLLKNYFHKNHLYRADSLTVQQRALSFVDDDWSYWTTCYLNHIYSNVVVINDNLQTIASNYRTQLNQGYEWIHLCAHSSPWGHTFRYGSSGYRGTVFNYEIFSLEPSALFYNLFACSGTRFVEENHSAGWYLFVEPYGLLVVGSTKTGSMLYFEDFYYPIGQQNMSIGDGFKHWFTTWGEVDWDWFYGMNILGDPTLKPRGQVKYVAESASVLPPTYVGDWQTPEVIAPDPESDAFPKIGVQNNDIIWSVWESGRSYVNGRSEIYGSYYDGNAWTNAMTIGPHTYWDYCPAIGFDNQNRPVTVWAGYNAGQYDLYYSIYTGSWSARQLLHTHDPAYDLRPSMMRDNANRLWVAWESRRNLNSDIYAAYFNGSIWTTPQQVTNTSADEKIPVIIADSLGYTWVFYSQRHATKSEIWGSYYTGSQWLTSGPVSGTQKQAFHPCAAVDENGDIWVVWQSTDNGNVDIYASVFNGSNWSTPVQVTTSPESDLFPCLTTHTSGTICLVYQSKATGDWNIYYTYCVDSTWTLPEVVADLAGADINPQIACDSTGELWICWQSYSNSNWEIMVTHKSGYGIIEQNNHSPEYALNVSSTVFSKNLSIMTKQKHQEIAIYDINGCLVQRLVSNDQRRASWSGQGIPAGIYFISTLNNTNLVVKKVLLLR